jgi:hypothetical protein
MSQDAVRFTIQQTEDVDFNDLMDEAEGFMIEQSKEKGF